MAPRTHDERGVRPTLLETDWNREWVALQDGRRRPNAPHEWDARAGHFRPQETQAYARDFLRLADIRPGESVLDMGCGAGALAIPLARGGHPVIAADFSPRMLQVLSEGAGHYGLGDGVRTVELAWDDDWDAAGIGAGCVDVAIASRSIATRDLGAALKKLDRAARRRCCITLVAGASPRYDAQVMDAIGAPVAESRDYVYSFNILVGLGAAPEVSYIDSTRRDTFDTLGEAVADFARMLEGGDEDRIGALRAYIRDHAVANPHAGEPGPKGRPQGRLMLDHERQVRWAFIAWDPVSGA